MVVIIVFIFVILAVLMAVGMIVGGILARRSPERMGRKYPESIDPDTGNQRILLDTRDMEDDPE